MGSENKTKFLGMPHGTASNKLKKKILFRLVQKCGEDFCYRCSNKIETVNDLSIEHKQPWENISIELFWDLDNIAFSHLRCNLPHSQNGSGQRKLRNEGEAWCNKHKDFLPVEMFAKNTSGVKGLQNYCKECHKSKRNR